MNNKEIGALGEDAAARYLSDNGYWLLERNYRVGKMGEIDIIAREKDCVCFVEVKTRTSDRYGAPSEAVNYKKQQAITRLAQIYLANHHLHDRPVRFDVIEVFLDNHYQVIDLRYLTNAF